MIRDESGVISRCLGWVWIPIPTFRPQTFLLYYPPYPRRSVSIILEHLTILPRIRDVAFSIRLPPTHSLAGVIVSCKCFRESMSGLGSASSPNYLLSLPPSQSLQSLIPIHSHLPQFLSTRNIHRPHLFKSSTILRIPPQSSTTLL